MNLSALHKCSIYFRDIVLDCFCCAAFAFIQITPHYWQWQLMCCNYNNKGSYPRWLIHIKLLQWIINTTASDLISFATKNSRGNSWPQFAFIVTSCGVFPRCHARIFAPEYHFTLVHSSGLHSHSNAFWGCGWTGSSMYCQKFEGSQWRYWYSVNKQPSGTFPATLPRISGGNRSSNEHQLGVNNKVIRAFVLLSLFIFQAFYKSLPVTAMMSHI